jgi:hypothetical protein
MLKRVRQWNAVCLTALVLLATPNTFAQEMKNHEFLELPDIAKKFWIQGAIQLMASTVNFYDKKQGQCIIDWYYKGNTAQKNGLLLGSMNKYSDATPTVTVIAIVELSCGKLNKKTD